MAHVLLFPFPAQGHVTSMLKLAELLSLAGGLHVTFLNSDYNHSRMRSFSDSYVRLSGCPRFRFRSIPDGIPDDRPRSVSRLMNLEESLRSTPHFRDILVAPTADGWPPVTCVIADGFMMFTRDVAEGLGIPVIAFRTISACSFWAYFCIPDLLRGGELPFPDGADLDEPVRGVPGTDGFLRRRDLPSFCRAARDHNDPVLQFLSTVTTSAKRARGLVLNTMELLEAPVLAHIRTHCPVTYALGPLNSLLTSHRGSDPAADQDTLTSASLWEEDRDCIAWLDSRPRRSVVYVSFGSLTAISQGEMVEFWHGLVNSGYNFLLVARPGLEEGTEETPPVPEGLEAAVGERGRLVRWAPQEVVLAHPAVGCFLTHSGWNSTLEGISYGVPMICWPVFADQQINSRFVSEVWRVGVDMKDRCDRGTVERLLREVMEGEAAEELRRSAAEKAEVARRSVEEGGSSYMDFQRLVDHIWSLSSRVDRDTR